MERLSDAWDVTAYHTRLFTDGVRWWRYSGTATTGLGTSLCFRKAWWRAHPFPDKNVGEDSEFVWRAVREHRFTAVSGVGLMHATIHSGNTSPRDLRGYQEVSCT